ncbi:endonuclease/exonuclease/phosphatase family protein [Mycolicibacterium mengxianglii]|uniref:endonuclease/exonuclease/phosphatase family protein n=1 Tax=Mycolicibacterium mengxianglii TaxID=2736649 RepID=UPI001E44C166|nr:endonuclease/exonuclease/phosphatase family protein [Mycolicibacterium mengxianglii]
MTGRPEMSWRNTFLHRTIRVPVGQFDEGAGRWVDSRDTRPVTCSSLSVATFNIWYDDYHAQQRYQTIATVLSREMPDVMVFQEVTQPALDVLLAQPWIRTHYRRAAIIGGRLGNYGMLLLSRPAVGRVTYTRLPTKLSRGYLTAEFELNSTAQKIVGVHLESGKTAQRTRARQLSCLFRANRNSDNVIVAGDFNMRDDENHLLPPDYRDVWPALRPGDPGYTEDTSVNLMRFDNKDKHRHVRFDRVLCKGDAWVPERIRLLGCEPVSPALPRVFPSDHFGVLCQFGAAESKFGC